MDKTNQLTLIEAIRLFNELIEDGADPNQVIMMSKDSEGNGYYVPDKNDWLSVDKYCGEDEEVHPVHPDDESSYDTLLPCLVIYP